MKRAEKVDFLMTTLTGQIVVPIVPVENGEVANIRGLASQ